MTTKTLIITPHGTAKEINGLGEYPNAIDLIDEGYPIDCAWNIRDRWQEIEDSLKEYKIAGSAVSELDIMPASHFNIQRKLIPGTTHKFLVNEVDKTVVIL